MSHAILLNDLTGHSDSVAYNRYIAPYILATKAREENMDCVVVEHFTRLPDLFDILENLIGPETAMIGISGTFLGIESDGNNPRRTYHEYHSGFLWLETRQELVDWLNHLRLLLEKKKSKAKIVLGGTKALFALQRSDMRTLFDFYVIGKAEMFFADLLKRIVEGKDLPFRTYEGANFLHESDFGISKTDKVTQIKWRKSDFILPNESLPLEIAKGCLYNCKYCNFEKQSSLKKELVQLKDELTRNYEVFGTQIYNFCDDCFNDMRGKVEDYCNLFLSLPFKIEWVSYARVDVAVKFPHTLELMVESGARGLFWGLETFDHKIGKSVGKGTDPELVKEMLINLKKRHGDRILSMGSFIIGLPNETEESIMSALDWIIESRALDIIWHNPLVLRPYSERLDKAVIDYADYSRNPTKYGFKEVHFAPSYWSHDTMDLPRAVELRLEIREKLQKNGLQKSVISTVFQYPHLRSLGFTHQEIVNAVKDAPWKGDFHNEIINRQELWIQTYSEKLKEITKRRYEGQKPAIPNLLKKAYQEFGRLLFD